MRKLILFVLIVPLSLGGLGFTFGKQAAPFPAGSVSAQRLSPGPHEVHSHDELFVDSSRPSPAHDSYEGAPQRELQATVWHPANFEDGPFPLIVYSHGFSSSRRGGAYLGDHLASHGYVVVAADFPLTNTYAPDRPWVKDIVNQPGDVSFLIDRLLAQSRDPERSLYRMIDERRIGVTGISLGGMTSTLVAFHPEMGDERVGAALSIAGPTAQFTERFFRHREVAFLMLGGDIDALVPFGSNAEPVLSKVPESQVVTVLNGSHTGFSGPSSMLRFMANPDALGCYIVERNIENDTEEFWLDQLGTPEQGIDYDAPNELCRLDPLPEAMNPLRQQMITAVVVRAFFDSRFARDDDWREDALEYLADILPRELDDVSYAAAD
jgi:predicted dienelactone hydrolase